MIRRSEFSLGASNVKGVFVVLIGLSFIFAGLNVTTGNVTVYDDSSEHWFWTWSSGGTVFDAGTIITQGTGDLTVFYVYGMSTDSSEMNVQNRVRVRVNGNVVDTVSFSRNDLVLDGNGYWSASVRNVTVPAVSSNPTVLFETTTSRGGTGIKEVKIETTSPLATTSTTSIPGVTTSTTNPNSPTTSTTFQSTTTTGGTTTTIPATYTALTVEPVNSVSVYYKGNDTVLNGNRNGIQFSLPGGGEVLTDVWSGNTYTKAALLFNDTLTAAPAANKTHYPVMLAFWNSTQNRYEVDFGVVPGSYFSITTGPAGHLVRTGTFYSLDNVYFRQLNNSIESSDHFWLSSPSRYYNFSLGVGQQYEIFGNVTASPLASLNNNNIVLDLRVGSDAYGDWVDLGYRNRTKWQSFPPEFSMGTPLISESSDIEVNGAGIGTQTNDVTTGSNMIVKNPASWTAQDKVRILIPSAGGSVGGGGGAVTTTTTSGSGGGGAVTTTTIAGTYWCSDSDGRSDPYLVGMTEGLAESGAFLYTDTCSGDLLTEFYCSGNAAKKQDWNCDNGCLDGACVPSDNIIVQLLNQIIAMLTGLFG